MLKRIKAEEHSLAIHFCFVLFCFVFSMLEFQVAQAGLELITISKVVILCSAEDQTWVFMVAR